MSAGLLESAGNVLAGLLDLGRTRFELFGTELREELARLAVTVVGGMAVMLLSALAIAFGATAIILTIREENRMIAAFGVAIFFVLAAALLAWQLWRMASAKPRAFDATIAELQRDLDALKP